MSDDELYRNRTPAKVRRADEAKTWQAGVQMASAMSGLTRRADRLDELDDWKPGQGVRHVLD